MEAVPFVMGSPCLLLGLPPAGALATAMRGHETGSRDPDNRAVVVIVRQASYAAIP